MSTGKQAPKHDPTSPIPLRRPVDKNTRDLTRIPILLHCSRFIIPRIPIVRRVDQQLRKDQYRSARSLHPGLANQTAKSAVEQIALTTISRARTKGLKADRITTISGIPRICNRQLRVHDYFHCHHRMQRSFLRTHPSSKTSRSCRHCCSSADSVHSFNAAPDRIPSFAASQLPQCWPISMPAKGSSKLPRQCICQRHRRVFP